MLFRRPKRTIDSWLLKMCRSMIIALIAVALLHGHGTNAFRQFERLVPEREVLPAVEEVLPAVEADEEVVFTRETLTLTTSQVIFIQSHREVIAEIERNPVLVTEHRHDEFIPLTVSQQKQIYQKYGQFFKSSSELSKGFRVNSNARLDIFQAEGIRVCPVSSDWSAITLAFTADNNLVQVVQLPELSYQQLIFEEKCLSATCQGVTNSKCVAVPRFVRACVIDLATNEITISDIQVDCCACHIPFPWQRGK